MPNKEVKNSVSMGSLTHKNGFTFLTTLFMLSILALTLPFLGYTLQTVTPSNTYDELSVHEFFRAMRDELAASTSFKIVNNKLELTQELVLNSKKEEVNKITIISQYEDLIRRQGNSTGHEVLLFDVQDITFYESSYGLKISIINSEGKTYGKKFIFYNE